MKVEIKLRLSCEKFGYCSTDARMVLKVDMPLSPFVGLTIVDGDGEYQIEEVVYDVPGNAILTYVGIERYDSKEEVAAEVERLERLGWKRED